MKKPEQPAEGKVIEEARSRTGMSVRKAAEKALISDSRWRHIVTGYQPAGGLYIPVKGPAETVMRMAKVVGLKSDDLNLAGRPDVAALLRDLEQELDRVVQSIAGSDELRAADWSGELNEIPTPVLLERLQRLTADVTQIHAELARRARTGATDASIGEPTTTGHVLAHQPTSAPDRDVVTVSKRPIGPDRAAELEAKGVEAINRARTKKPASPRKKAAEGGT